IDTSDDMLVLNVAQARSLGTVIVTASDLVTLSDTGAAIAALTNAQFAALAGSGIDRIDASDDILMLSVAQLAALGDVRLTATDQVILRDTGAAIGSLPAVQIGGLAGFGIDSIDATDNVLALTVAQFRSLGTVGLTQSDTVVLVDLGGRLAGLAVAEI